MAKEKTHRGKTQTLSLRLDPKSRFVLEFLAKVHRRSITMIVEDAIYEAAKRVNVSSYQNEEKTWENFWDVNEGARAMLMLDDRDVQSDYEDDELREFINFHIEFFSPTFEMSNPDRVNLNIIWPQIDIFLTQWRETKRTDPWAVGNVMSQMLLTADVPPPQWPRKDKAPPKPVMKGGRQNFAQELDDEVPF